MARKGPALGADGRTTLLHRIVTSPHVCPRRNCAYGAVRRKFLVLEIRPKPDKFFSELPPEAHFPSVRLSIDKASPDKPQAVMLAPTFPIQNFAGFPLCCYLLVSHSSGTLS